MAGFVFWPDTLEPTYIYIYTEFLVVLLHGPIENLWESHGDSMYLASNKTIQNSHGPEMS